MFIILMFLFSSIVAEASTEENRIALVIGNGSYSSGPLKNPVNDAADMAAALKELGFTVIEASNGLEALEMYRKNAAVISLVVADMGMPVMDGYELFNALKKLDATLPIIVSSGFGDSVVTSRIPGEQIAGLVSKPYNFNELRDVLRRVTDGHVAKQA